MVGLPNESMIAIVTPWPSLPWAYRGPRLYEFSIADAVKHRLPMAKQADSDGGVVLAETNW